MEPVPEPDTDGQWRPATIDAWRLTRRDITWWTPTACLVQEYL